MSAAQATVRSRNNGFVRRLRRVRQRAAAGEELVLIEGPRLLDEALRSGVDEIDVALSPGFCDSPRGQSLTRRLEQGGHRWRRVQEDILASLCEVQVSQGVLALAHRPAFDEAQLYVRAEPLLLVLVSVQDPGNLGAILRAAEAAGAAGAYLSAGCSDPLSWKALRGSMGSAFRFPHVRGLAVGEVLHHLCERGVRIAATTPGTADCYSRADLRGALALVLGNEGAGLPEAVLQQAHTLLNVPMAPPVESLNVAVAAGVLLFEAARQRRA